MEPIYLDYNATTPIDTQVADAIMPFLKQTLGNPSSSHWFGIISRKAVIKARKQVAELINCKPDEVIFTSGGTESNNCALRGYAFANRHKGNHIITSVIEHPSIIEVCKYLEKHNFKVTYLPVDKNGLISVKSVQRAITQNTILISIMHANNEVGTIQSITEIAEVANENGICMHTDAAQSIGKISVDVEKLNVDLLTIAGHKIYAPKGIGALFIKQDIKLEKLMFGAKQESNHRAGTENVLEIVGLGKACEIAKQNLFKNYEHLKAMRDRLWNGLVNKIPDVRLNGHPEKRLPNTLNVSFLNMNEYFQLSLFLEVAASTGSACHSNITSLSYVLEAMNIPVEYAMGTIRFSTGKMTTKNEIDKAITKITEIYSTQIR
ncbi:MAG: cysteine desulfurase family protein [Candidatus Cloacimonadota bacterium]|nr:cysteine desulfurase family protein [Candidatus Cloacimonadota bacterium]